MSESNAKVRLTSSPSPITTSTVALAGCKFSDMQSYGDRIYMNCQDPSNQGKGRVQSCSCSSSSSSSSGAASSTDKDDARGCTDIPMTQHTGVESNVRSAVHEYGGGSFCVGPGGQGVIYTDFPSHVVYWNRYGTNKDQESNDDEKRDPVQIFPAAGTTSTGRLADMTVIEKNEDSGSTTTEGGGKPPVSYLLLAIMEDHPVGCKPDQVVNTIVTVSLDGKATVQTLASGMDFYASPRLDNTTAVGNKQQQQQQQLAYVGWNHPNMPWDGSTLFVQNVEWTTSDCCFKAVGEPSVIHGAAASSNDDDSSSSSTVSVYAPQWFRGDLYFLSNETGWYNLYRWKPTNSAAGVNCEALLAMQADFTSDVSGWVLGPRGFTFLENGTLVATYSKPTNATVDSGKNEDDDADGGGGCKIVLFDVQACAVAKEFDTSHFAPDGGIQSVSSLTGAGNALYFLGGSPTLPTGLWYWADPCDAASNNSSPTLVLSSLNGVDKGTLSNMQRYFSQPRHVCFPSDATMGLGYAYGFFYPPSAINRDSKPEADTALLPPLLVKAHGGPTARTTSTFRLDIQFWTSRGFAVLDVDYGGSTGYGKDFQQSLKGKWGLLDVADVLAGAKYCMEQKWVHADWVCIDGRSAGGYTTLAVLVVPEDEQVFRAGASLYGIGDLTTLAAGTHKFESRYMDRLVAPFTDQYKHVYEERCPIRKVQNMNCPVLLLQGEEDHVVPPDQAEDMFRALISSPKPSTKTSALVLYKGESHGFRGPDHVRHALLSEYFFFCSVFGLEPQPEDAAADEGGDGFTFGGVSLGERIVVE